MVKLDIRKNRASRKYSTRVTMLRVMWMFGKGVFRITPRTAHGVRAFILKVFGARIGRNVNIYSTARIFFPWNLAVDDWSAIGEYANIYNLGKVEIGKNVTISQYAHLCAGTHDYTQRDMPLVKLPIEIRDNTWIATEAFIGPGVVVGEGAVVGARAVVVSDVPAWCVVVGNPARVKKKRTLMGSLE